MVKLINVLPVITASRYLSGSGWK